MTAIVPALADPVMPLACWTTPKSIYLSAPFHPYVAASFHGTFLIARQFVYTDLLVVRNAAIAHVRGRALPPFHPARP